MVLMRSVYVLWALLLVASASALVNLSTNETYVFSFVNATNESANESFFCGFDAGFCPLSSFVNLSLVPGDSVSTTNGSCSVSASCSSSSSSAASCVVHRSLSEGDHYRNNESACDIDIDVRESACSNTGLVPVNVPVSLTKEGSAITLVIGNQTRTIDGNLSSFVTYETPILCPVNLDLESESSQRKVLDICTDIIPGLASHLKNTLQSCDASIAQHAEDVKACDVQKSGLFEEIGQLKSQVSGLEQQVATANKAAQDSRDAFEALSDDNRTHLTTAWVFGVMLVIAVLVVLYLARSSGLWGGE